MFVLFADRFSFAMPQNFLCGSPECCQFIPPHLRHISCTKCNKFFHVRCCNINKKQFNDCGKIWLCLKCRPKEKAIPCGSCRKPVQKNNALIQCSICNYFFHSKCSKITFNEFARLLSWECTSCCAKILPFSSLDRENLCATLQAKDLPFGDHIALNPSFSIQSLLDDIRGHDNFHNSDYVCDLTNSKYYTPSEFLAAKFPKDSFSMFHINIASLSCHIDDLKSFLSLLDHPFDVIAVTETKIKEDDVPISNFSIEGYNFFNTPTKTDFGGVGLFVKKDLNVKPRNDLSVSIRTVFESHFIEIESGVNKNLLIGGVYRHHTSISNFLSEFSEKILHKITSEKNKVCAFLGDLNIDLLQVENHDKTCEFFDILSAFGFRPLILQPSRVQTTRRGTSATLIDNIFVNDFSNISTSGNITTSISDHFPQFCSIPGFFIPSKNPKNRVRYGRSFKNFSNAEFKEYLLNLSWPELFYGKNTNQCTDILVKNFERLLDEMAPVKRLSNKEMGLKQRPWITHDILATMKERDDFHKQYVAEKNSLRKKIIFRIYKSKRNIVVKNIRASKNNYYSEFFQNHKNNSKKTWEGIRDVINLSKKNHTVPNNIFYKNTTYTDTAGMSNCFNDFFVNIGNSVEAKIPRVDTPFTNFLKNKNDASIFLKPIDDDEIRSIISSLSTSKACGPNSIPTHILKNNIDLLVSPLKHIINLSFSEGCFPQLLKLAEVCPIFKKKDKNRCENYRPISLLSNLSKIFERAMHTRIYEFLESHSIFSDLQFGFRKKHSTNHALLNIIENIKEKLDQNIFSCGVFIDLEKAFDTVNHKILVEKLEFYGIRGLCNQWFVSYLSNRKQQVRLDGTKSSYLDITCGVPQGSILGPLLFLIYINDMKNSVKNSVVHHFADDTNLLCSDANEKILKKKMNEDLKLIFTWLCSNRLSLNVDKTEFIVFRPPRKVFENRFTLSLNRITLYESTKIKYLGLILDKALSWKHHIFELRKKLSRAVGILYKMRSIGTPQNVLVSLYYSLFHSHMSYGICVYGLADLKYTSKIALIQKRAIRILSKAPHNAHTQPLFSKLGILNFDKTFELQLSILMWQYDHGKLPNCFNSYFKKIRSIHKHNTRASSSKKLSENVPARTDFYGKKSLHFIGPRVFNKIVELDFFTSCNSVVGFKTNLKRFLIHN